MMVQAQYLSGRFLVAMPGMFDDRFARTVNVMCVHDENGAMALDIGHYRDDVRFHAVLEELDIDPGAAPDCRVLHGGPVEPGRGFVLHSPDWGGNDTIAIQPLCALSTSLDVLKAIARGTGPEKWLFALGYAGWGPGQLESEMRHHGWYVAQGREDILFGPEAEARWMATWQAEGIDPALLASETGSA